MHEKLRSAAAGIDEGIPGIQGGNAPSAEELERIRQLISEWRGEVAGQWSEAARRGPEAARLASLFREWAGYGEDSRELLFLILGSEWLYRARVATEDDIRLELLKVQEGLTKGWGQANLYLVGVLVDVWTPALRQQLRKLRYLVSLRRPAASSVDAMVLSSIIKHGATDLIPRSRPLISRHRGAVQKLSTVVPSIVAAHRLMTNGHKGMAFGARLATTLAGRPGSPVAWAEVRNWCEHAKGPQLTDGEAEGKPEALSLTGLAGRWRRYFRHGGIQPAWSHLTFGQCLERAALPHPDLQAFRHTGHDLRCLEWLYSLRFSVKPAAVRRGGPLPGTK